MLNYNPLTSTEHKKRWPEAVIKLWDYSDVVAFNSSEADRPSLHSENRFDFHDGLKMFVSQELVLGNQYLHVSASAMMKSKLYGMISRGRMSVPEFCELVKERVRFLSGREIFLAGLTQEKGTPHFYDPQLPDALAEGFVPLEDFLHLAQRSGGQ